MTSGSRLVVLTSADSQETTAALVESLGAWCAAGMLAEVVWVPADELARSRAEARCRRHADGVFEECSLEKALSRYHRREVWLAALRHPRGPGGSDSVTEARHTEECARQSLADMLGSGIELRSLTVQVAVADGTVDSYDCTPAWDFHLIHDSNLEAHQSLSRAVAADREPLGLCAMVALCASGGWRDAEGTLGIDPDRFDGILKPVRFVHCQMRVLHTPPVPLTAMQNLPPWPLPQTAGVERAQPDAVPPLSLVAYLAREGRLVCRRPPPLEEPSRWSEALRLARRSLSPSGAPTAKTRSEAALQRLADRVGTMSEELDGVSRLELDSEMQLTSLAQHIERSDLLAGAPAPASFVSERNPWTMVRETVFGLVDGAALPGGVAHPTRTYGDVEKRVLWTDPSGLAPPQAPSGADDILSGSDTNARQSRYRYKQVPPDPYLSAQTDGGESQSDLEPGEQPTPAGLLADGEGISDAESGSSSEPRTRELEPEPLEQVVEHRDTLMERLAESIARGLREAQQGFRQNCARISVQKPYEDAFAARRKALWPALATLLGLIFVVAYAIDRRWNYLADVWEFLTPFEAVPYGPAAWPLIGLALVAGFVLCTVRAVRLFGKVRLLDEAEAKRRRTGEHRAHYATELLRLCGIAQQFADHRSIITEFLHRPFGHDVDYRSDSLSAENLAFSSPPPHSMLVAYAQVEPDKLYARRHDAQESAVEPGWLSDVYEEAYAVWSERYRSRVLGEFQDPDHDTTVGQAVVHRNRRDGSELYGARTDFTQSVVADLKPDENGWAIRQAASARAIRVGDPDALIDDYLGLFGPVESVHGWQPGVGAAEFFKFADRRHEFDWEDLLCPGADRPTESPQPHCEQHFLEGPQARSLVVAWHLELTGPVRPQDQAGWQGIAGGDPSDSSSAPSRPVV